MSSLKSRLPSIAAQLRPKVSAAIKRGAELVADDARIRVPVGPPEVHLKEHINVRRRDAAEYEVSAGNEETFYGHMVEFGTRHSAPRPFLVPALEAQTKAIELLVREALGDL